MEEEEEKNRVGRPFKDDPYVNMPLKVPLSLKEAYMISEIKDNIRKAMIEAMADKLKDQE